MKYSTNLSDILTLVSDETGIPINILTSDQRNQPVAHARHIAIYLACNLTWLSKNDIAERLNMKDHSSLYYGYRKIAKQITEDSGIKKRISEFVKQLNRD